MQSMKGSVYLYHKSFLHRTVTQCESISYKFVRDLTHLKILIIFLI